MKKNKYHIACSRILMICFIAGQLMIYGHQHSNAIITGKGYSISKNNTQQTVSEKCYLCDAMHHNAMVKSSHVYINPVKAVLHVFQKCEYSFTSLQLIHAAGRAPPLS